MNGQMLNSNKRYEESLKRMSAPVYASQLPKVKMNLAGLSRYARDKGVSVRDLTEEEKNQFGVFCMDHGSMQESPIGG